MSNPPKAIAAKHREQASKLREQAQWDERFAPEDYWFGTEPTPFLAEQAQRLKRGTTALAIADGEGRNGVWLARQGLTVTSVDLSPHGVAKAQRLAAQFGVSIDAIEADLETWDWGAERFDLVVGIRFQFAGPALRDGLFREMKDVLKPGGLVMIEGYRPEQLAYGTGEPPPAENLYTVELLRAAFAEFEILHLATYDRAQPEDVHEPGLHSLIDMVARKP
jgi:SAM-dependent methyltransferase